MSQCNLKLFLAEIFCNYFCQLCFLGSPAKGVILISLWNRFVLWDLHLISRAITNKMLTNLWSSIDMDVHWQNLNKELFWGWLILYPLDNFIVAYYCSSPAIASYTDCTGLTQFADEPQAKSQALLLSNVAIKLSSRQESSQNCYLLLLVVPFACL